MQTWSLGLPFSAENVPLPEECQNHHPPHPPRGSSDQSQSWGRQQDTEIEISNIYGFI